MDEWMMINIYDNNNNIRKALFSFLKVYRQHPPSYPPTLVNRTLDGG